MSSVPREGSPDVIPFVPRESRCDRLPPHNLEAERGILGAILIDPELIHEVRAILRPEDFYRETHQALYRLLVEMADAATPMDTVSIHEELERRGEFDRVGGRDVLREHLEAVPHAADAVYHARIVREKAVGRDLIRLANDLLGDCYSNSYTADELTERAEKGFTRLALGLPREDVVDCRSAVTDSMLGLLDREAGIRPGLSTGFAALDEMTGGLQPGQLIVIASRPSIGKTSLALNIAERVASGSGREPVTTLFVSLEMSRLELGDRLLCGRAGVDGSHFRNPSVLRDRDRDRLGRATEDLSTIPLLIDDSPTRTVAQIASNARRLRVGRGLGLLVIDYLQLIQPEADGSRRPRHEIVAEFSVRLKALAKELGIPVLLLSQLNREVERREDKRPQLADIRESGAIEQDANAVLLLHRPEFYDREDSPGEAELIVAKNRSGPTGIVRLAFDRRTTRFGDYAEPPR